MYLRVRNLPGVSPKPPFGLILDSTASSLLVLCWLLVLGSGRLGWFPAKEGGDGRLERAKRARSRRWVEHQRLRRHGAAAQQQAHGHVVRGGGRRVDDTGVGLGELRVVRRLRRLLHLGEGGWRWMSGTRTHTHMQCVCVYIYIYIYLSIYLARTSTSVAKHHSRMDGLFHLGGGTRGRGCASETGGEWKLDV